MRNPLLWISCWYGRPRCLGLLTVALVVAVIHAETVDVALEGSSDAVTHKESSAAEKALPNLPQLSHRQLHQQHRRLRQLSKVMRPDLPEAFHNLTSGNIPKKVYDYGGSHPLDPRRAQVSATVVEGRPRISVQYPIGKNVPHSPIRFQFVTEPLKKRMGQSEEIDQTIGFILDTVLPQVEQVWDSYLGVIPLPQAVELNGGHCFGLFSRDIEPISKYPDTDTIILVGGYDVLVDGNGVNYDICSGNTLVVGSFCQVETYGRPVIGFLNFCLNGTTSTQPSNLPDKSLFLDLTDRWRTNPPIADEVESFSRQDLLTAAIHQMAHVLGFHIDLFKNYLNSTNAVPYTQQPVPKVNINCTDGSQRYFEFPASNTIARNTTEDGLLTFTFVLPLTQTVARNRFNCQTLNGALLEADPNAPTCVGSHFNGRVFFGELMERLAYGSYDTVSSLTLSVLYDSFWYLPFYGDDNFAFGAAAGCEFASGARCIVNDTVPSYGKGFYCANPIVVEPNGTISLDNNDILCDPLHRKWALCDLYNLSAVPSGFLPDSSNAMHWFSDRNLVSTTPEVDFCPMPIVLLPVNCNDSSTSLGQHYKGESYGSSSRCVNAVLDTNRQVPACFNVTCDTKSYRVLVNGISCKYDGQIHSILTVENKNATFECPRFATICPELATCPSDCTAYGVCDHSTRPPTCRCTNNVTNVANCQDPLRNTFAPSITRLAAPTFSPAAIPTPTSSAKSQKPLLVSIVLLVVVTFTW